MTGAKAAPPAKAAGARSGVQRATGRNRPEWFAALDAWGAVGRPYREIADWLTGAHGLSAWWAQKLIVEYEQARGIRQAGVRRDGTFEGGASKVIGVTPDAVRTAFRNPQERERWLPGAKLTERPSSSDRTLRFDWAGGATRLAVTVIPADGNRCQVAVQHGRLPDAAAAQVSRAEWRERLVALKRQLEAADR